MFYHSSSEKELLNPILENITDFAIIATDLDNNILLWNRGAEILYGFKAKDILKSQIPLYLLHKIDSLIDSDESEISEIFRKDTSDINMEVIRRDSISIPVKINVRQRFDSNNSLVGFLIIVKDISQNKIQNSFRKTLIEITHIVNSATNLEIMLKQVNEAICNFINIKISFICLLDTSNNRFKVSSQHGLCGNFSDHYCYFSENQSTIPENKRSCFQTYEEMKINSVTLYNHSISTYVNNHAVQKESILLHVPLLSDGVLIGLMHLVVSKTQSELLLSENQYLSLIANEIAAGIQRKKLESQNLQYSKHLAEMVNIRTEQLREKDHQLIQSGKLATLGEMATGIAHEINQPLGAIRLTTEGLIMAKNMNKLTDEILKSKLQAMVEQIDRITKIINHLRAFARQSSHEKTKINIGDPLLDVFKLIGEQLKTNEIMISVDLSPDLPPIMSDHNKLEQVFLNIITNAKDAFEDFEEKLKKQDINIYQEFIKDWNKTIQLRTYDENEYVCVDITDNAGGIDKNGLDKIFEPFYTTKVTGKGTGLGLSISYGIIKEMFGSIEVSTTLYKGTTFTVKIPKIKP